MNQSKLENVKQTFLASFFTYRVIHENGLLSVHSLYVYYLSIYPPPHNQVRELFHRKLAVHEYLLGHDVRGRGWGEGAVYLPTEHLLDVGWEGSVYLEHLCHGLSAAWASVLKREN